MVVMIVLITTLGRVAKARHQAGHNANAIAGADQVRADQEIRHLKERIQVLERVVTENHGSIDLDRQIERLRDR